MFSSFSFSYYEDFGFQAEDLRPSRTNYRMESFFLPPLEGDLRSFGICHLSMLTGVI